MKYPCVVPLLLVHNERDGDRADHEDSGNDALHGPQALSTALRTAEGGVGFHNAAPDRARATEARPVDGNRVPAQHVAEVGTDGQFTGICTKQ